MSVKSRLLEIIKDAFKTKKSGERYVGNLKIKWIYHNRTHISFWVTDLQTQITESMGDYVKGPYADTRYNDKILQYVANCIQANKLLRRGIEQ